MDNMKLDSIHRALFDRLGIPLSPTNATSEHTLKVAWLDRLTYTLDAGVIMFGRETTIEMMRAMADAMELASKK